ncbi:hypothetical protein [Candidatus Borreliella tachyglossi]|uniref:hypothetical protein n=1 Tax=Candidatus Borreliella tachyglossi TaxID=1964448 RepID=UPI004040ED16
MKNISIFFVVLSAFTFSCILNEVAFVKVAEQPEALDDEAEVEAKRDTFENLKGFLSDIIWFFKDEDHPAMRKRHKEFFEWLEKNDSDSSKRSALGKGMDRMYSIIKREAATSKEVYDIIKRGKDSDIFKQAKIESPLDIKGDEQVDALVKYVLTPEGTEEGNPESINRFFVQVAGSVFMDEMEGGSNQIFENIKEAFTYEDKGERFTDFIDEIEKRS